VFRCYAVVFSVFVAVLETEWAPVINLWKVCSVSLLAVLLLSVTLDNIIYFWLAGLAY
jgi:hypothetical protein